MINNHIPSPFFTRRPFTLLDHHETRKLSTSKKILTVTLSIFSGVFSLGVGGVFAFFAIAKILRDREIKKISASRKECSLPELPDELLLQVFSYLQKPDLINTRLVCHRFGRVCLDKTLLGQCFSPYHYLIWSVRFGILKKEIRRFTRDQKLDPTRKEYIEITLEAIAIGRNNIVKELMKNSRIDPLIRDHLTFIIACRKGRLRSVKKMLNNPSIDPSAFGNVPILHASYGSHTKVVKLLLTDSRVDPSVRDNSALYIACRDGNTRLVKTLLSHPKVDIPKTALLVAKIRKHTRTLLCLLNDSRCDHIFYDRKNNDSRCDKLKLGNFSVLCLIRNVLYAQSQIFLSYFF